VRVTALLRQVRVPALLRAALHPMVTVLRATPHRYPMLLIDRIDELIPRRHGIAVKAVSVNEFQAHGAPPGDRPLLPPTFVVDALGQLAIGVLSAGSKDRPAVWYLAAIEGMRFDVLATPGDLLRFEATVVRQWATVTKVAVLATIDGTTVAEGVLVLSSGRAAEPPAPRTDER
jgi:3-hydroxyacyl-[acyl-carrier-protein] dehydratase